MKNTLFIQTKISYYLIVFCCILMYKALIVAMDQSTIGDPLQGAYDTAPDTLPADAFSRTPALHYSMGGTPPSDPEINNPPTSFFGLPMHTIENPIVTKDEFKPIPSLFDLKINAEKKSTTETVDSNMGTEGSSSDDLGTSQIDQSQPSNNLEKPDRSSSSVSTKKSTTIPAPSKGMRGRIEDTNKPFYYPNNNNMPKCRLCYRFYSPHVAKCANQWCPLGQKITSTTPLNESSITNELEKMYLNSENKQSNLNKLKQWINDDSLETDQSTIISKATKTILSKNEKIPYHLFHEKQEYAAIIAAQQELLDEKNTITRMNNNDFMLTSALTSTSTSALTSDPEAPLIQPKEKRSFSKKLLVHSTRSGVKYLIETQLLNRFLGKKEHLLLNNEVAAQVLEGILVGIWNGIVAPKTYQIHNHTNNTFKTVSLSYKDALSRNILKELIIILPIESLLALRVLIPQESVDYLKQKIGSDRYDKLARLSRELVRITVRAAVS